jgi:hypothetical protein
MKVSAKTVSGIGLFFIIGLVLVVQQLSTLHQLLAMNRDLTESAMRSGPTVLRLEKISNELTDNSVKFLGTRYPEYEKVAEVERDDFLQDLARLQAEVSSDRERLEVTRLRDAFDNYWHVFGTLKQKQFAPEMLPPDFTIARNHLFAQTDIMLDSIQLSVKEKVAHAAQLSSQAERKAWLVGLFSIALGVILAIQIVRSINAPLRLLTQGVRAIAKGQFWYRLPTGGSDEFAEVARDFNLMSGSLVRLDHAKRDIENLLKECPICGRCYDVDARTCTTDGTDLKMNALVERNIDGRYRLLRLIGRGGMGAVYQAQDLRLNRVVAVKLLTGTSITDGTSLKRFEREARAAAALTHRNIIGVYDCGRLVSHGAYLVMEYKQGQTWRSELLRQGQIAPHIVSEWTDQVLDGLAVAHEHGVVHRDLKPENLLLTELPEGSPVVKILDFGLAKWSTDDEASTLMTGPGEILGTYGYMSPEQLSGRPVDERTDLFAVGVITFEMLTGRRPFTGETVPGLLRSLVEDELRFPGEGDAVRRLESILQWSVAKDPKDRARSAEVLRRELVPALRDCPPIVLAAASSSISASTLQEGRYA